MTAKKTSSRSAAGKALPPKRKRVDWEAVERDYRTGKFTLRELEAKHGVRHSTIGSRVKREGWTQDLADAVRQATSAALIAPIVVQGASSVVQAVQAAAEVNRQVILGHRRQAGEARAAMETARAKLLSMADTVADIREAATFVSATESLSRTTKTVIEIERTAFGLDEAGKQPEASSEPPAAVIGDPAAYYAWFVKQGAAK